jgi:L-rhamnose-H+ transport protein
MELAVVVGVLPYVLGGLSGSAFYLPLKGVRHWAWESHWMIYAVVGLVLFPWTIAFWTTPALLSVLHATPGRILFWCYLFGAMWGIGGLTFGITVRYLGVGLGFPLVCGIIAAVGTLVPPIYNGQFASLVAMSSGILMLCGVAVALLGIVAIGMAGMAKERELSEDQKKAAVAEFNFLRGLLMAMFCGVTSAGMFLGIRAGEAMERIAADLQAIDPASPWIGLPKIVVILAGGFTVNFASCLAMNVKNGTVGDYASKQAPLWRNYLFSAAAGILWYGQFMFLTMGDTRTGLLRCFSASVLMSSMILFSTVWGVLLHEWKGTGRHARRMLASGLALLIASLVITGYANVVEHRVQQSAVAGNLPSIVPPLDPGMFQLGSRHDPARPMARQPLDTCYATAEESPACNAFLGRLEARRRNCGENS